MSNKNLKTIKFLKENLGSKLCDIDLGEDFLELTAKAKSTEAKINKWDYSKVKSFCTAKKIINKTKRQPTKGKKIFANHISDKQLLSKIY